MALATFMPLARFTWRPKSSPAITTEEKFMVTQKCWILKYVAGNPAMFTRVRTEGAGPGRRGEVLEAAEKVAANGWRAWVEHAVTSERIFESEVEKTYKQAHQATA